MPTYSGSDTQSRREMAGSQCRAKRRKPAQRDWFLCWLIPILLFVLIWQVLPIVSSFLLSFTDYRTGGRLIDIGWIGLQNYLLCFRDPVFREALRNTLVFAAVGAPIKNLLAMLIAQLLFTIKRGSGFFRTAAFLPVITPPLATILLFQYLYHFQYGALNQLLLGLGLHRVPWLTSAVWVKPSLILLVIWNSLGYPTIILLAGLGTIPEVLGEAARIDGANNWQSFWRITWPLMRRPLAFVFVTDSINWLQLFTEPQVLTQGGPAYHSLTAVMLIRDVGLTEFRGGAASALAFVLFAVVLALTLAQLRFFRTEWEY